MKLKQQGYLIQLRSDGHRHQPPPTGERLPAGTNTAAKVAGHVACVHFGPKAPQSLRSHLHIHFRLRALLLALLILIDFQGNFDTIVVMLQSEQRYACNSYCCHSCYNLGKGMHATRIVVIHATIWAKVCMQLVSDVQTD